LNRIFEATKRLGKVDTTIGPEKKELTSSQIQQLTSGGYTSLHKHRIAPRDLRIARTQFTGTLQPRQIIRWFTFNWPALWNVVWTVVPTTRMQGVRQLEWNVQVEKTNNGNLTYWIIVKNLTSSRITVEGRYAILRA